eukprot:Lithocolla_globosa_v1_NODE_4072_length_1517_cov_4.981532.p1 type:complete len:453 gc:universal NODE_4072_length_1517_cov_4.981532:136-1494(+)
MDDEIPQVDADAARKSFRKGGNKSSFRIFSPDGLETEEEVDESHLKAPPELTDMNMSNRKGVFSLLTQFLGHLTFDIHLALPVSFNDPSTLTSRNAESFELHSFLDEAALSEDPQFRMTQICLFVASQARAYVRPAKPFAPLLGETFEFVKEGSFRYLAEQVNHRPAMCFFEAKGKDWTFRATQGYKVQFWGNHVVFVWEMEGRIWLKDQLYLVEFPTINLNVNNCCFGKIWFDLYANINVNCPETGLKAGVMLPKTSKRGRHQVRGVVIDSPQSVYFSGNWDGEVSIYDVALPSVGDIQLFLGDTNGLAKLTLPIPKRVIKMSELFSPIQESENRYMKDWSLFTHEVHALNHFSKRIVPDSDARVRQDRKYLEELKVKESQAFKKEYEHKQRAHIHEQQDGVITHFEKVEDDHGHYWKTKESYWRVRADKIKNYQIGYEQMVDQFKQYFSV